MIFRRQRRGRFGELVQRQLDLFRTDEAELFAELEAAEHAYDATDREDAEDAYAEVQLVLDAGADRLADLRSRYAATLEEDAAARYENVFAEAAKKRFPRLTGLL